MFIVTNRQVFENKSDLKAFGSKPNPAGPNELRMAEAEKVAGKWKINILPDEVTPAMAEETGIKARSYSSAYVMQRLMARVNLKLVRRQGNGRNFALFVHGFNNNMQDALDRAAAFQRNYGVEVLVFSWPANGGGAKGVVSDKSDARDSIGALDRVLEKLNDSLQSIHAQHEARVTKLANERFADDAAAWDPRRQRRPASSCAKPRSRRLFLRRHLRGRRYRNRAAYPL